MTTLKLSTISIVFAATLAAGVSTGANAQDNIVYGNYSPPTQTLNKHGILPFLEAVEAASGGSLATTFVGGGSLVGSKTGLFGMRDGLVDGIMLAALYYPTELPEFALYVNMGAAYQNTLAASGALTEMAMLETCSDCTAELESWNVHSLGGWSTTAYDLLCVEPYATLAELEGKRIRGSGHTIPLISALGAVAANTTVTEVYEAMQRGQVDCSFGSASWLESYSIGDSAKYVIDVNAGGVAHSALINIREDLWQSFSTEQRQALVDSAAIGVAGATWGYINDGNSALATEGRNYQLIAPGADVASALAVATEAGIVNAVQIATDAGIENAEEKAANFMALYEKWIGLTAGIETEAAYVDLLNAEVYSKVSVE